ncbi:MAG: hypothetical protein ACLUKN_10535 [Bacilli bacterium]
MRFQRDSTKNSAPSLGYASQQQPSGIGAFDIRDSLMLQLDINIWAIR